MADINYDILRKMGLLPQLPPGAPFDPDQPAQPNAPVVYPAQDRPEQVPGPQAVQPATPTYTGNPPAVEHVAPGPGGIAAFGGKIYTFGPDIQNPPAPGAYQGSEGGGTFTKLGPGTSAAYTPESDPVVRASTKRTEQMASQIRDAYDASVQRIRSGQDPRTQMDMAAFDDLRQQDQRRQALNALATTNPQAFLEFMQKQQERKMLMDVAGGAGGAGVTGTGANILQQDALRKMLGLPAQSATTINLTNPEAAGNLKKTLSSAGAEGALPSQMTLAAYKASLAQQTLMARQKQQELPPDAVDFAKNFYLSTGTLPPMGLGIGARSQVYDAVGKQLQQLGQTPTDIEAKRIALAGLKAEQAKNSQIRGTILPYMENLDKHIANLEPMIDKTAIDGSPLVNHVIQNVRTMTGDPNIVAYDNAIHTMLDEYTRIVTTVTGSGQVADTERKRWIDAINSAHTPEQMHAVIDQVIKRDRQFREESLNNENAAIQRAVLATAGPSQPQTPQQTATTGNVAPPSGVAGGWSIKKRGQ